MTQSENISREDLIRLTEEYKSKLKLVDQKIQGCFVKGRGGMKVKPVKTQEYRELTIEKRDIHKEVNQLNKLLSTEKKIYTQEDFGDMTMPMVVVALDLE